MLELTTKAAMAEAARRLAQSYELVQHGTNTYIPAHWSTQEPGPTTPAETIWIPLDREKKKRMGNQLQRILFANDSEITNFDIMLRQFATEVIEPAQSLLVRTEQGLRRLTAEGELAEPTGEFHPNVLAPVLNTNEEDKAEVFGVFTDWLNSEEEAHSLLTHLATALSPGWSAVKYILLIGDGRNGKSLMLSMVTDLFGADNISGVTRQQMAERLPVCVELNGKLLNIVMDGEMGYIKDSSVEKTLIAGEPAVVRMLYENGNTRVQTNALFIEALNSEPKTRDKSGALQKRISRFFLPNVYPMNREFEKKMRSPRMLGAFLALLLDHFVQEHELAEKLAPTKGSAALQVEQTLLNSPVLQFISHLVSNDASMNDKLRKQQMLDPLVESFMAWRLQEGFNEFSTADTKRMFKEAFHLDWTSVREAGKVSRKQRIRGPKPDVEGLLDLLRGEEDGVLATPVVED